MPLKLLRHCLLVTLTAVIAPCAPHALAAGSVELASTAEDGSEPVVASSEARSLTTVVTRVVAEQDARVADALSRIDGEGRRLLALRSYLRNTAHLAERWSWTAEQIAAYEASPERVVLQAEIDRVRAAFAQENPGFELWVNPQVRNLDIQLEQWNTNESVGAAAAALLASVRALVATPGFERAKPAESQRAFEQVLADYVPEPKPTVAAPGLSPHGQMRAIDFQVHKDGAVVAGTRTSTIAEEWDGAGWTRKLEVAVRSGSSRFVGPLQSPREPWHYTYAPETVAAQ